MTTPRRVFVTGALGFIGSSLSDRYRAAGAQVCGVDRVAAPELGVVAGDVSEPGEWTELVRGNVLSTRRALCAARDGGASRFVHLSSVRAFSDVDFPANVDESWPVRPNGNFYVDTKIASEQVALQAHAAGDVDVTVIRPGDVYGPGSRPWTILILEAIRARQFMLPDGGRGVFSPVFIDNLVDGIVLAASSPDAIGQVFTLADGRGVSCLEFFSHYTRMLGVRDPICLPTQVTVGLAEALGRWERLRGRESEATRDTMLYFTRRGTYSIDKARRVLGFEPAVDLAEGMRRTEAWLREQGMLDR